MKKRVVVTVSIIIALFFINFVFAESISEDLHLNIQTTNSTGGVVTGTFNFVFNISKFSNCASPIYTNSTTLTTDSRGIISYYLPNVSLDYSEQYYLCYYRDGILKDSVKIARSPYSFVAKNVTLSGIVPDYNFNIGSYNMSAQYYFGNGTYLVDVNDTLSQLNCTNGQVVKWNSVSSIWYCSDDNLGSNTTGDISAVNTDGIYLNGGQGSGEVNLTFNEAKLNQTIDLRISTNNQSIVNWANSIFAQISNIVNLVGNWSAERVNYYNTTQIVEINTSIKNYVDFQNTSQNNYIALQNGSIVNYINLTNNSMKNYVDSTFLTNSNQSSMSVNNSQYLDGYDGSFFMPLNTSVYGNFDFNGGWTNNGISIIDGSLYAQAGYFYNISSLQVSNLNVNGSLLPDVLSGQFDIGSVLFKWRDLYLSGTINAPIANITGTLYVAGVNISGQIAENNESMKNYVISANTTLLQILNNGSYLNSGSSITWANVMNGTLALMSNLSNYLLISNWNATNISYVPYTGANQNVSLGNYSITASNLISNLINHNTYVGNDVGGIPIVGSEGSYVTAIGERASFRNNQTYITAIGYSAGYFNKGQFQTAIGSNAGLNNTGYVQTAIGAWAGWNNTKDFQTVIGSNAGLNNTGHEQTAIGSGSGYINSGNEQTAIGASAGNANIGDEQTAIGNFAGSGNSGDYQTAIGSGAGYNNNGSRVIGIGLDATRENIGNDTIAIGYQAGRYNNNSNQFIVQQQSVNTTALILGDFLTGKVNASDFCTYGGICLSSVSGGGITWANVMNGTLALMSNLSSYMKFSDWNATNTSYMQFKDWNATNASYLTTETNWNNNYSQFLLNNVSTSNYIVSANTTLLQILNNGSYLNTAYTDTFIGNYSTFLTLMTMSNATTQNDSMKNYVIATYMTMANATTINDSVKNYIVNANTTLMQILNNGSYLNSGSSITWANVMNGTLALMSNLSSYMKFSDWNATNTSYMQFKDWNSTNASYLTTETNWNNNYSQFLLNNVSTSNYIVSANTTLLQILNNGSYLNTAYTDTFIGNYSTFLTLMTMSNATTQNDSMKNYVIATYMTMANATTINDSVKNYIVNANTTLMQILNNGSYLNSGSSITWANVMNGTLALMSNLSSYMKFSDWNSTNASYLTTETNWNNNYSQFLLNNVSTSNYIVSANTTLLQILNNGSYLNTAYTDTFIGNYSTFLTHMTMANATTQNDSMKNYVIATYMTMANATTINDSVKNYIVNANTTLMQILNNGSYLNSGSSITWANVMNGTLALMSNLSSYMKFSDWNATNTSYMQFKDWNSTNASYLTTETNWNNNYSQFLLNNVSTSNYIVSANTTLLQILNNGSYLNTAYTDTFIGNYSTFLTYMTMANATTQNDSMKNYVIATYMTMANATTINDSVKNYIVNANTTLMQILNNGSYLNSGSSITWANVMNGTLALMSNLSSYMKFSDWNATNTSYMQFKDWNSTNASYLTTETNWNNNYSQFLLNNVSTSNYIVSANTTLLQILNNGSYLNTAYTDTFIGNYSTFLTHMTMANATTQNDSMKNYVIATYMTMANATTINDSVKNYIVNANTTLMQILNNGSYLNSGSSITWANVMNGTLALMSNLSSYMKFSDWNATNTSYMQFKDWNATNASYLTTETNWNNNYSQFLLNNVSTSNYIVSANTTLLQILNNGSYLNTAYTDTFIGNYSTFLTLMTMSNATTQNDSMKNYVIATYMTMANATTINDSVKNYIVNANTTLLQILNNGSYLNSGSSITWANVMNGTLALMSNLSSYMKFSDWNATNTSYMQFKDWNSTNASYLTTETNWNANYSQFLLNNVSTSNYIVSANTTLLQILNNGSYLNTAYTDTFIGNYSTFLTHMTMANATTQNDSMKNYVIATYMTMANATTINDSVKNYIVNANTTLMQILNNGSYLNSGSSITWANVMNGTLALMSNLSSYMKFSDWNATNISYLEKTGGTMTGNLNLSANVNLTMNGGNQISSNVTCVTIKGATSTLEIC